MPEINNNIYRTSKTLGLHLIIWAVLFFLNFLFLNNFKVPFDFIFHIKLWLIYIFLFYVNFYLLMPALLFKKKVFFYILSSILLITGTFFIKSQIEMRKFDKGFLVNKSWEKRMGPPEHQRHKLPVFKPRFEKLPPPRFEFMPLYGLLLVFAASTSLRLIQKWQDDEKRKTEIEKERVSTELLFLKQQINPHFLFNALNNIYSLTLNTSSPASEAVLKLSSILRYMLYDTEHAEVLLKDELNIIVDFIELQKIRITEKVKVGYQVIGDPGNLKIAPLLLIPIIENAFKHGVDNVKESFIEITVKIESNQLELTVRNKIVNNLLEKDTTAGIGIKNIKRRLDLLYPDKYSYEASDKDSVFYVELKLNLNA
jgi:two-component system, LytTR family, sensor kinase